MSNFDEQSINKALAELFSNGVGEVGLEVGTDPGLAASEHIRIPECMFKRWAVRITPGAYDRYVKTLGADARAALEGTTPYSPNEGDTVESLAGKPGWVVDGELTLHEGAVWVHYRGSEALLETDMHLFPSHSAADIRQFVTVNTDHIKDDDFDAATRNWIHACRFWAVAAGFVMTTKSKEWVRVPDSPSPPTTDAMNDAVAFIASYAANAFTASAARATSWRKSNHATGGAEVAGFPRRWLNKMGYIAPEPDKVARQRKIRAATNAFYIATHASSVHAVLALMASDDTAHWATVDPSAGLLVGWEVGESTRIRMSPKTQVAGTAIVVDSVVVLKMAIKEGIAPLIAAIDQVDALVGAYKEVEEHGVAVASYAKWFLDGHPEALTPRAFSQKDAAFADLVGELAIIGTKYYAGSTIAGSAALSNAADQLGDETAKVNWSSLASQRKAVSGAQMVSAVAALKGASASGAVAQILAGDEATIRAGVGAYNSVLTELAGKLSLSSAVTIDADRVVRTRLGAAQAAAPGAAAASSTA